MHTTSLDQGLIKKVLSQWSEEYVSHANHMTDLLIYQYHMICSMLYWSDISHMILYNSHMIHCYSCLEDGLLASLDQRDFSRLHGICSLMFLSVPTFSNQEIPPIQLIKGNCRHCLNRCIIVYVIYKIICIIYNIYI